MRPTPAAPAATFSDSIKQDPDWLQNWKKAPSGLSGFSNEELDNYVRAGEDGQLIAGDTGGSTGGKGIRGITPFNQASGLPANTVSSVDGMPSNRQYKIAANFEVRDDGTINKIPAYYTALNTNTNQIDYVIGQTDLPKFMKDPFSYRVQAWADNQPAYARDAGGALTKLAFGAVNGDGTQIRQGAEQLGQSWKEALTSPDYLLTTALSWTGGVIAKESIVAAQEANAAAAAAARLNATWAPTGITTTAVDLAEGRSLIAELRASGMSAAKAEQYANGYIQSGSTIPVASIVEPGGSLVKIVPSGTVPSATTGYWTTQEALAAELENHAGQLGNRFGLPPSTANASTYDIYKINANARATTFQSTIAGTTNSATGLTQGGGALQVIVPNRSLFSSPQLIGSTMPH